MDRTALRTRLDDINFSSELPDEVLDQLADVASPALFPAGATIFREGNVDSNLYLINSGRVVLEMLVPGRGSVRLLSLGPGDMLAWSALLGGGQMTATAVAVEDTEMITVPGDRALALCVADPKLGYEVMRRMAEALSRRLLATRLQLLDLFSAEAPVIIP